MTCSGFRIQPDWDKSFSEKDAFIWFHQYDSDRTHYCKLERQGEHLVSNNDDFECSVLSPKLLQIRSKRVNVGRSFQSPDSYFNLIQTSKENLRLHLTSFDVSPSGELLLSAFSDHTFQLRETQSGAVRRNLKGHVGEIYKCRFFPSGVVALTAGADMQLKIWCLLTGRCAATLGPKCAGALTGVNNVNREPGGHHAGILDVGIIHRGRNIVAIDRLGWLRLWDVSTQTCISAIPVTQGATEIRRASSVVLEEITCLALRNHPRLPIQTSYENEQAESWYKVIETSSPQVTEVGTSNTLVAVGTGIGASVRLFELASRQKGCIAQFTLPHATGSVESCAFPESLPHEFMTYSSKKSAFNSYPLNTFSDYGLFAGGQNGEVASWDIRQTKQPLWELIGEKGAVHHLRAYRRVGDPFFSLFVCRSDGRIVVYPYDPGVGQTNHFPTSLELTGINCEPIRGLSIVPQSSANLSVWSASHGGLLNYYKHAEIEKAFGLDVKYGL